MAPRRLLLLLVAWLLGAWGPLPTPAAARRGPTAPQKAPVNCSEPPQVQNAEVSKGSGDGNKLRYSCVKNYKRKAGTSSLAVCRENDTTKEFQWEVRLSCIRDPSLPATTTEDPRREAETSTTETPQAAGVNTSVASAAAPYGSETPSPSASITALLRTAKPTRPGRATETTSAPEVGRQTPGTVSESSAKCESSTAKASQPATSKRLTAGDRRTAVPPGRVSGVTPEPSVPVPPIERQTGLSLAAEVVHLIVAASALTILSTSSFISCSSQVNILIFLRLSHIYVCYLSPGLFGCLSRIHADPVFLGAGQLNLS
uniref:flocculation protein FLO11-like n=1 Tax=Podarcis muralis TaxID=64176 RepID=UPI0010A01CBC|nr:flocculation protein FLO11-like [Podarcis muralis]